MFSILIYLGAGIIVGILLHKLTWVSKVLEKLTSLTIYLLLFSLGLSAGLNKVITSQLHTLGLTACTISLFAMAGSVGVAWVVYKLFFNKQIDES
jgi:Kef-type K+ transport system membrane component KefB